MNLSRRMLAAWLLRHTRSLLWPLGLASLLRIVGQLLGVGLLVVAVSGIGDAIAGEAQPLPLALTMVGLALAKALLRYLEQFSGHYVAFAALARLRELFFARLAPQAPAATAGAGSGELSERATRDIDRVEVFFAHTAPPAVSALVVPVVALTWLGVAQSPALALTAAPFLAVVVLLVPLLGGASSWRASQRVTRAKGVVAQHVSDSVQGAREVLAFEHGEGRLDSMDAQARAGADAAGTSARLSALRGALVLLAQWGAVLAVAVVGGTSVADGQLGLEGLASALAVVIALFGPTRAVESFVTDLNVAFASAGRLHDTIERDPLVTDARATPEAQGGAFGDTAALRFTEVTFAYPGTRRAVVQEVSFEIARGEHVALVGASGSGKSTIASLALRFWDPDAGTVELRRDAGLAELPRLPLDELRARVALVAQRPYLTDGTIAENVALARPDASEESILEALHVAALDDWVLEQPRGLATPVRERGGGLSGGQRQRVAIACAVLADPELLVLDEATSALDAETEQTVRERLGTWATGRSILEVSHRIDALGADRVLVVDAGRIVESGAPAALRAAGGPFQTLLER